MTISHEDSGLLHWCAVESGNDDATEAGLLLKMGIRLALRRFRQIYGKLPIDDDKVAEIDAQTPGEQGWNKYHRPGVPQGGGIKPVDYDTEFEPPLTLPDWAGDWNLNPHRERGFAGHGTREEE